MGALGHRSKVSPVKSPSRQLDHLACEPLTRIIASFPQRRFWTRSQRISDQFLDAYDAGTGGGVVSCSGMAPQVRIAWRELHRPLRIGNPNA
jgi:hypothetical protein